MSFMKKRIVLCADDYGQASAISQGILDLVKNNRLTAVSCMVNTGCFGEHVKWLLPYHSQIDIGLHFNLTEGQALSEKYIKKHGSAFKPLSKLLLLAFTRGISLAAVEAECHAQIDKFHQETGFLPLYLDGHQHVHQFPIVRQAVLSVYEKRLRPHQAYVRLIESSMKNQGRLKKMIIQLTGTKALKHLLIKNKIPFNQSFAGIYPFAQAEQYSQFFKQFLDEVSDGGIIMCHPALHSKENSDAISDARFLEYQYFSSPQLLTDCREKAIILSRFFSKS